MEIEGILASLIFGAIGFVGFVYGKKQGSWRMMGISAALMGYPYLITNTVAQYAIGAVLTLCLFIFRE